MTITPRFQFDAGTEVSFGTSTLAISQKGARGYELVDTDTGEISVMGFTKFVEYLKSGAMTVSGGAFAGGDIVSMRLEGLTVAEHLSEAQQELGRFHHAICLAIDALVKLRVVEEGDKSFAPSIRKLNCLENRRFIQPLVQLVFGQKVFLKCGNLSGGKVKNTWVLYSGRTLMKYYNIYSSLKEDDDVIAALATLDHLKGNEKSRIALRLRELMTQGWVNRPGFTGDL